MFSHQISSFQAANGQGRHSWIENWKLPLPVGSKHERLGCCWSILHDIQRVGTLQPWINRVNVPVFVSADVEVSWRPSGIYIKHQASQSLPFICFKCSKMCHVKCCLEAAWTNLMQRLFARYESRLKESFKFDVKFNAGLETMWIHNSCTSFLRCSWHLRSTLISCKTLRLVQFLTLSVGKLGLKILVKTHLKWSEYRPRSWVVNASLPGHTYSRIFCLLLVLIYRLELARHQDHGLTLLSLVHAGPPQFLAC